MNQVNESKEIREQNKEILKINSEESSEEESIDFFHINKNPNNNIESKSKENSKIDLLNKKRKISNDSLSSNKSNKKNNNNKNNDDSISSNENSEKKNINNNKKEKNKNYKSVKSKTRQICQFYINGACKKGDKCPYSHDAEQIHKKELCKFYLSGKCTKGAKCLYSHDLSEIPCKYYHGLGFCDNLQNCPFSHERLDQEGVKEFIINNEDFLKETKKKYGVTNMDEFFEEYLKEKEGKGEEYIMLPDFIKEEDKKKEKEINENKIPLGLIIMSNNNKVLNEIKSFYSTQNFKLNMNMNSFNGINNNLNRNNSSFNNNNIININKGSLSNLNNLTVNNSNNSINNKSKSHDNLTCCKFNDSTKFEKIDNITKTNSYSQNININKTEKNKLIEDNNENNKSKNNKEKNNEIIKEEKEKPKEEKKENKTTAQPVEINPFLNPMLISSNAINNLF